MPVDKTLRVQRAEKPAGHWSVYEGPVRVAVVGPYPYPVVQGILLPADLAQAQAMIFKALDKEREQERKEINRRENLKGGLYDHR